jgi:hypothetical protein
MIRKDPTGSLSATLRGHADVGDRLFRSGRRVSNRTGFGMWLGELFAWRAMTTESLAGAFQQEAVEEFLQERCSESAGEDWHRNLRAQLQVLRNEVEFLDSLHSTLVWQALEQRCRLERLHRSPGRPTDALASHAVGISGGDDRHASERPAGVPAAGTSSPAT